MKATQGNLHQVLKRYKISKATLDNWVRTSIPDALNEGIYNESAISDFITSRNKLNGRANKKQSRKVEIPKSLFNYLTDHSWLKPFAVHISSMNKALATKSLIEIYTSRLAGKTPASTMANFIPHNEFYSYSIAYQIILNAGAKSETGAYYTPQNIIQDVVSSVISKEKTFYDPCCGTGFYTIEYVKAYIAKFNDLPHDLIFMNDLDPAATEIAKLNLSRLTNGKLQGLKITNQDALKASTQKFDLILTNPPYGIRNSYSLMQTTEIFSHFIHDTLSKRLTKEGVMNFILPASVLTTLKHKEIRKYILENFDVVRIKHLGKAFDGVYSDIVSIEICNRKTTNNFIEHIIDGKALTAEQKSLDSKNYTINSLDQSKTTQLENLHKIPNKYLNACRFALGIVTGDNNAFLSEKPLPGYKDIISGKEIGTGTIHYDQKRYIKDTPEKYQQKPAMTIFKEKKLVYKFISKRIVSAVDETGILTLNSANIIILNNLGLEEEYVSAILNSDLVNLIYLSMFGEQIKVLRGNIEKLPIFIFSPRIRNKIVENYKNRLHAQNNLLIDRELKRIYKKTYKTKLAL